MALPFNLVFVRHGHSEANRVQKMMKGKDIETLKNTVNTGILFSRHDSHARLTPDGVEQAKAAGEWLRNNDHNFDRFYVSPHVRTRETAGHLKLDGQWIADDRFRERDRGEVSGPNEDFTDPVSEISNNVRNMSEWYWKPQGGESLATGVRSRVESIMESLYRRGHKTNSVVAVVHGEFIRVAQFVIERLTPDQFAAMDEDSSRKITNTMVFEYTRQNPEDRSDVRDNYQWRRATCPWDESQSWDNGRWVEFDIKKYSDTELLDYAERFERAFTV